MFFLKRLERVIIRREHGDGREERMLTRSRYSVSALTGGFACDLDTLDAASAYLVLSREVEPSSYRLTITEAIDRHQLDPRYAESTSTAEVSVAVPYAAADADAGHCYTFLPMDRKAPSPFAGHLNARPAPGLDGHRDRDTSASLGGSGRSPPRIQSPAGSGGPETVMETPRR